jgi:hypothetical protein
VWAQKDLFASQGIDGDYGIAFLGKVNMVYGDDLEIMSKFYRFVARCCTALNNLPRKTALMGRSGGKTCNLNDTVWQVVLTSHVCGIFLGKGPQLSACHDYNNNNNNTITMIIITIIIKIITIIIMIITIITRFQSED